MTLPVPLLGLWPEKHHPFHSLNMSVFHSCFFASDAKKKMVGGGFIFWGVG